MQFQVGKLKVYLTGRVASRGLKGRSGCGELDFTWHKPIPRMLPDGAECLTSGCRIFARLVRFFFVLSPSAPACTSHRRRPIVRLGSHTIVMLKAQIHGIFETRKFVGLKGLA